MTRRIHRNRSRPASLRTVEDLEAFFAGCDEHEDQGAREPEWAEREAVIEQSRRQGLPQLCRRVQRLVTSRLWPELGELLDVDGAVYVSTAAVDAYLRQYLTEQADRG